MFLIINEAFNKLSEQKRQYDLSLVSLVLRSVDVKRMGHATPIRKPKSLLEYEHAKRQTR